MLIIEADGGQHAENADDEKRTAFLNSKGWRVLRFWNHDILSNPDGVLSEIIAFVEGGGTPHPTNHSDI